MHVYLFKGPPEDFSLSKRNIIDQKMWRKIPPWHELILNSSNIYNPDSKIHGATMGPIWDRQDPDGPHVGPMNFAIWEVATFLIEIIIIS